MQTWIYWPDSKDHLHCADVGEILGVEYMSPFQEGRGKDWARLTFVKTKNAVFFLSSNPVFARFRGCIGTCFHPFKTENFVYEVKDFKNFKIETESLSDYTTINNKPISLGISDPRVLAMFNMSWNVFRTRCQYEDVRDILQHIPTREEAIRYLRRNRYADGYRTRAEDQKIRKEDPKYEHSMYQRVDLKYLDA